MRRGVNWHMSSSHSQYCFRKC